MSRLFPAILVVALGASSASLAQSTSASGRHAHDHGAARLVATAPAAVPQTEGQVQKVDLVARKLTVKHGRIENLGMAPMTMMFSVSDPSFLTMVKPGDKVRMRVEDVGGVPTIVALQRQP